MENIPQAELNNYLMINREKPSDIFRINQLAAKNSAYQHKFYKRGNKSHLLWDRRKRYFLSSGSNRQRDIDFNSTIWQAPDSKIKFEGLLPHLSPIKIMKSTYFFIFSMQMNFYIFWHWLIEYSSWKK